MTCFDAPVVSVMAFLTRVRAQQIMRFHPDSLAELQAVRVRPNDCFRASVAHPWYLDLARFPACAFGDSAQAAFLDSL